jgi:hypothetical protein
MRDPVMSDLRRYLSDADRADVAMQREQEDRDFHRAMWLAGVTLRGARARFVRRAVAS